MQELVWQQWVLMCLFIASSAGSILMMGRPREPSTPGVVLFAVILNALLMMCVISIPVSS